MKRLMVSYGDLVKLSLALVKKLTQSRGLKKCTVKWHFDICVKKLRRIDLTAFYHPKSTSVNFRIKNRNRRKLQNVHQTNQSNCFHLGIINKRRSQTHISDE